MSEPVKAAGWMQTLLWSGAGAVVLAWGFTLYWTLVSYGYLDTPWGLQ